MSALSYVRTASATSPLALIAVALSPSAMDRFPRPSAWFGFTARHRSYASIAPVTSPLYFFMTPTLQCASAWFGLTSIARA